MARSLRSDAAGPSFRSIPRRRTKVKDEAVVEEEEEVRLLERSKVSTAGPLNGLSETSNGKGKAKMKMETTADNNVEMVKTEAGDDENGVQVKVTTKRSSKRKAVKSDSEADVDNDGEEGVQADAGKPKRKRKAKGTSSTPRVKKYKGPALPSMIYPLRNHQSKKFVGSHVSISGGAHYAPHSALRLGAKAFGMFTKNQKTWKSAPLAEDSLHLFPLRCKGQSETIPDAEGNFETVQLGDGIGFDAKRHIVPHGSYLTNMCNPSKEAKDKSYANFVEELKRTEALGIGLFNFHPGTTTGQCTREFAYAQLAECINNAHKETEFVIVLLENMAHGNNTIGNTFEDLAAIIALVTDKSRIGVCIDTCHSFASGYDLRTKEAYDKTMADFDRIVGLNYIKAFHVNDSEKGLGEHRDLHANIGAGQIGLLGFQCLMQDPRFDGLPFILETPMLQGSLNLDAPGSSKKMVVDEKEIEKSEADRQDASGSTEPEADLSLSLGASTWKMEIELLHALEEVPLGETNERIDLLSGNINSIVADYKEKKAKAAEKRKEEAAKARAEKKAANGVASGSKAKGKGRKSKKREDGDDADDADKVEENGNNDEGKSCDSHDGEE